MIEISNYKFDIPRLEAQCKHLLFKHGTETTTQMSLKHTGKSDNAWFDGIGTLLSKKDDFKILNEELKGTYLEQVHDIIAKDHEFTRMRIMRLFGRSCMSLHFDSENRIHIPVTTNKNCLMIVDNEVVFMPADGSAYLVDTTKIHTALNSNLDFERIHLLFDLL